MSANFTTMKAAADFLGNGAIEVPIFQKEIFDIIRRTSVALQRFRHVRATGDPHRYFEELAIGTANFDNKRALTPTPVTVNRVERYVPIKAITAQTNITLFDREVTQQQGQFAGVVAKDIEDTASSIIIRSAFAVWNGTDTSLTTPTTNQYVGLLTQITQHSTIAPGTSIIDGLKKQVALMSNSATYLVRPTAIYINSELGDYIDREAKAQQIIFGEATVAGVVVRTLATQAGYLPLINDAFLQADTTAKYSFDAPPSGTKNYYAVILTESAVEMPYVSGATDNPDPRIFQLGLQSALGGQYVGVLFDAIVAKGADYAHAIVAVQRP